MDVKIIIQSHMDMVCEKNKDKVFDFDNDPIDLLKEDGWITADGTTLGADNGIGLAAALAVITDTDVIHGPIEILSTVDEETGLIKDAVKKATKDIPLRPNTVDPFTGENHKDNTGDNIPYITWDFVEGSNVWITALPKGGGSENMSKLGMLKPGVGIEGVKDFVVTEMIKAGGNPCPPTIVGVGIGGGADLAMKLGKKSLLRPVGDRHKDKTIAAIEEELIKRINDSGIGPMGLGGKTTVLDVHIEKAHRHPASLPVGIAVQCWANRRAKMVIHSDGSWEVK